MFRDRCRFEGFNNTQIATIKVACDRAEAMAAKTLENFKPVALWFGATDGAVVGEKLRMMYNVIYDDNRWITFVNRAGKTLGVEHADIYTKHLLPKGQELAMQGSGIIAYAFPVDRRYKDEGPQSTVSHVGSGMRLYLNDTFFGLPEWERGVTVYHEMTHKVLATNDHCYDPGPCQRLARTDPQKAIDNADNFALFANACLP